jgi:hypothetical protein
MSNLFILAQDKNLAVWKLEYSSPASSNEWYEYHSGVSDLVKLDKSQEIIVDEYGNPLPVKFEMFDNQKLLFLSGKLFRLTVEDLAGNYSVSEGMFDDEIFLIQAWDIAGN